MKERLPANNVIDNRKVILGEELLKILPKTEHASIAVGYFFISGLAAVIQPMTSVQKIRLLISNTTDKNTAEALIEGFHSIQEVNAVVDKAEFVNGDRKEVVIRDSKDNVQQSLEYMRQTVDDRTVIESLVQMMTSKQIEVRVYPKEKLHAKAYILEPYDKDFAPGLGIVGSSNLSLAGISHNSELNLKTYNALDLNRLLEWFDELWDEGLEFTHDFDLILRQSWAGQAYSPRDLFLKAAYIEYKDRLEERGGDPIWEKTFPPLFPFQKTAVDQSLTMFEIYGGVILADVVGLGKTYVGTALLKHLQLQEYRPLIVCPPALVDMWEKFCADYEVDAKILSRGQLSIRNFELSRAYKYKDRDLVLIDESHHFRNNNSRQYENMQQFMQARDARAILLTATPYSNDPQDIQNQLMLFHETTKTSIPPANETDLAEYFSRVRDGHADLVDLLRNIMIRRTRRYVLKQWGRSDENGRRYLQIGEQRKYFPERKMETNCYNINRVYSNQYQTIVTLLSAKAESRHLTLARYSLGSYVKEEYKQVDLYKDLGGIGPRLVGLIRMLLLKRMESSLDAFQESVKNLVSGHKVILKLLDEEIVPIGDVSYKAMYDIARDDPRSIEDPETVEEFKKKMREAGETKYKFEAFDIKNLTRDIRNDLEVFESIDSMIRTLTWKEDDKLHKLQKLLDTAYGGKKVLVFTEFATTAEYLHKHLDWNGVKDITHSNRRNSVQCARRFDPKNNPGSEIEADEVTLLISTDVLSEGMNLQAGEVIINYDFHWNPTRLIQRAGRVDRIGSKNEFVIVHNFLPDPEIERDLNLEKLVGEKISDIQKIIGEDYKILKTDEQINESDIYAIYKGDESILDKEDNQLEPSEFEKLLRNIQINDAELWDTIRSMPNGIRSSDGTKSGGGLLIACERGADHNNRMRKYYLVRADYSVHELTAHKALKLLHSDDVKVHQLPKEYDRLVSVGLTRFQEAADQMEARESDVRKGVAQRWVISKLLKMISVEELANRRDEIDVLRKAYSAPITRGKLNRELQKIKKSNMDDTDLLEILGQLYRDYELQDKVRHRVEKSKALRILYSKYVGDVS